jgi:uncharacterized membrane protein YdjX (TVP38/TMEM64 family)
MAKFDRVQIRRILSRIGLRQIVFIVCGVAVLAVLALALRELPVQAVVQAIHAMGPVPFFLAMGVLPIIGFPVTPFYLLAGATFGVGASLIGTALSQALNLVLAYWLARRYLRGVIEKIVERSKYTIPDVQPKNYVNFALLVKITPGPPNFLKSFILGLARIPFGIFFIVSWPTTMGFAVGVIIFGDSLMDRNVGQAILGFILMIAFLIGIKFAATYYSKKRGLEDPTEGLEDDPPSLPKGESGDGA